MSNYFSLYCTLLSSKGQLTDCRQADSVSDLLMRIKLLWDCTQLDDNELLGEINRLNQIPVDGTITLAGNWLPYRYHAESRSIYWCLPTGHATEPFQDEYISRCRQQLLNQIIQPCSSLKFETQQVGRLVDIQPAGFIFHLSRCGSTLISGCLSELDATCILSESPLLTDLLLDSSLTSAEQKNFLQLFIDLQAAVFPDRPQMIIKWNAWDIFRWELIRKIYPDVPVIFLVRDPVEILASHQRSSGRHMAGDVTLANFHPVFAIQHTGDSMLDWQIQVLRGLLLAMTEKSAFANTMVIDYQHWGEQSLVSVLNLFGCGTNELGFLKIQERMRFHSKLPGQVFVADKVKKQNYFTPEEQERILTQLAPAYNQLNKLAQKTLGGV